MVEEIRISDDQGRIIRPGTWYDEEIEQIADELLREAQIKDERDEIKQELCNVEIFGDFVKQPEIFRDYYHNPQRIFYPCCGVDISPLLAFPTSEIILMDREEYVQKVMKKTNITEFLKEDVLNYDPRKLFDLVLISNPQIPSNQLTRFSDKNGYIIANNYHESANELMRNKNFISLGRLRHEDNSEILHIFRRVK